MANGYRKILVAYDGSKSAKNALSLACQMAREGGCWLKVVAVVPTYIGDLALVGITNVKETIEGPGRKLLAEAKSIAASQGTHILTNLEQGEPYERIVQVAEEENCDLIVMGRRGQSHLERELMGAVTARVIGHTPKDVLVVPESARLGWDNLVLATDGEPQTENALAKALRLAGEHGSTITAITVVYTNDEIFALAHEMIAALVNKAKGRLEAIVARAAEAGVNLHTVVKEGEPHQAITSLAREQKAALIVMGTHGRKGLGRLLLMGSVTERTIGYAECPVLIVH
ncbi:MAG: universal stress protein [Desulfobulbaceae bacterium]|nr:universal stress protein [Desulfobulbaceae bacterium]